MIRDSVNEKDPQTGGSNQANKPPHPSKGDNNDVAASSLLK